MFYATKSHTTKAPAQSCQPSAPSAASVSWALGRTPHYPPWWLGARTGLSWSAGQSRQQGWRRGSEKTRQQQELHTLRSPACWGGKTIPLVRSHAGHSKRWTLWIVWRGKLIIWIILHTVLLLSLDCESQGLRFESRPTLMSFGKILIYIFHSPPRC